MILVDNLCKSFNDHLILDHLTFTVNKGEVLGIVGENGAGKSTLLQCLAGIYRPEAGKVCIVQKNICENETLKAHIGYVADNSLLLENYHVKEMIQFFIGIYPSFCFDDFNRYNEIFQIPIDKRIAHLSKGMKTRLTLMLHLSYHPNILILDEPTSGLDVIIKKQVLECIIDEIALHQTTVIIASHHLNELEKLCDNIAFLHHGKLTCINSVEMIKKNIQKIEVTFSAPPDAKLLRDVRWLNIETIGHIYYFITLKNDPENLKILADHGANHITVLELSLEEIFSYTLHKKILNKEVS